ncbi:MAG: hypothetical protein Q7K26_06875, partial [bacterium]|nr:hypothetical protein [bacterium]
LLLDIGVAGTSIFGAMAVIMIAFIALNYFNILSLSDLYPKYLSLLPRKDVPNGTSPTQPPKFSPYVFSYDMKKAEKLLTQYLKDNIKPEFLPAKIEIKQGLSIDGKTENIKYEFGSRFTTNKDLFSVNFHYIVKTNTQNDFSIFIQPSTVTQATATAVLANSLIGTYFINPFQNISNCNTKLTTSFCEDFRTESNGKRGFGIAIVNQGAKTLPVVFTCFIPKESKYYSTQTSCIRPQ